MRIARRPRDAIASRGRSAVLHSESRTANRAIRTSPFIAHEACWWHNVTNLHANGWAHRGTRFARHRPAPQAPLLSWRTRTSNTSNFAEPACSQARGERGHAHHRPQPLALGFRVATPTAAPLAIRAAESRALRRRADLSGRRWRSASRPLPTGGARASRGADAPR